ncbi:MAG: bifunctional UDP-N-acetylglucosamine diphosphorylase/glucosamine-1-phosphate N-acetyltransferase GlmU, partial [Pseudomonadota bacterium]
MSSVVDVVVLAAGKGARMRAPLPKVLHPVGGQPMLARIFQTASSLLPRAIHIVHSPDFPCHTLDTHVLNIVPQWVLQPNASGTGNALLCALPSVLPEGRVLVLFGDVPLLKSTTLEKLLLETPHDAIGILTAHVPNPTGFGRIVRDAVECVQRIVEERDATESERNITEINSGIMVFPTEMLLKFLPHLSANNDQQEYYLTDIIELAISQHIRIVTVFPSAIEEIQGVNDQKQRAQVERIFQRWEAERLMQAGVMLMDPARLDVRGTVQAAPGVVIDVDVILEGTIQLDAGVEIGAFCALKNVHVHQGAIIRPYSHLENAIIYTGARVGPYARLRPGAVVHEGAHIGNFVEIKESHIGPHSKVGHLSYIGNATVGAEVNVGAGTITCNYDGGPKKHHTTIGDHAFIGSGCQLVAPITVGAGATVGKLLGTANSMR